MLTFRVPFVLHGDLLKTMTNCKFNVDFSNPRDRKGKYEFGKQLNVNMKQIGRNSNRDLSLAKLFKLPAVMTSGISTIFLPSDLKGICDRLNLLLQEKRAGNNSDIIDDGIIAIADKSIE